MDLATPMTVRVVKRYENGGGQIEIPLLPATTIDLSRTAGGGKGSVTLTPEDLQQIVSNFGQFHAPVPVGFLGHGEDRGGPQPAFIDSMRVMGDRIVGTLDLGPSLFDLVVNQRAFRGFSAEIKRDPKYATAEYGGWVMDGGVFTNRPATETNFRVAAAGDVASEATATVTTFYRPESGQGEQMSDKTAPDKGETKVAAEQTPQDKTVSLAFHQSKVAELQADLEATRAKCSTLESRLASAPDPQKAQLAVSALEAKLQNAEVERDTQRSIVAKQEIQLKGLRDAKALLESTLTETTEKLHEQENANLSIKVREIVLGAIDAGVPPAVFDGYEGNPGEWMTSKYASFEAFRDIATTLRGVGKIGLGEKGPKSKSGHDPATSAAEAAAAKLSAEEHAVIERLGLSVDFTGVTTEKEARARLEAAKAAR